MRPKACGAHSGVDDQAALADLASGDIGGVDGAVFTTLLVSGYAELARNKDELNTINVFPVPDGDTGRSLMLYLASLDHRRVFGRR